MGILVRGSMKRKYRNSQVRIAFEGKEIFGNQEQEKEWSPKRTIEYYEALTPQVKERENKDGEIKTELVGGSRWTDILKRAIALKMTKSGKIRDGNKRYWSVKAFRGKSGGGFEELGVTPKKAEKWLLKKIKKGDKLSVLGTDYQVFRIFRGKVGLVNREGGKKWMKQTTIYQLMRKLKAFKVTIVKSKEELEA